MGDPDIPDEVRELVQRHIRSLAELEVLLLLEARPRPWSPADVATELRFAEPAVQGLLVGLKTKGFLEHESSCWRYAPSDPRLVDGTRLLARVYRERRVAVTTLVYAQPPAAIRAFADAFRFKKE